MQFSISIQMPDFEGVEIEFSCPLCRLETPVSLGQIQREEYIICRGCHSTIKLIDQLGDTKNIIQMVKNTLKGRNEL